jgi:four helix bundle protein
MPKIQYHWEINAYKLSIEAAMEIYELSKSFPKEERYRLTYQIRKSSGAVSTQIAKGWRRRKFLAGFVDKMNQAEEEVEKTQARLGDCAKLKYLKKETFTHLQNKYQQIKGKLIKMSNNPQQWVLNTKIRQ